MRSWPTRWSWVVALIATLALTLTAPRTEQPAAAVRVATVTQSQPPAAALPPASAGLLDIVHQARERTTSTVERGLAFVGATAPGVASRWVTIGWIALSALVAVVFGLAYLRVRRMRRRWPVRDLQGTSVRVSQNLGPAVVGLARPEIVVPQWLLDESDEAQRLVIDHERQHVRARDSLLLAGGCVAAVCLPWNPGIWWMLSRLRLTTEVDCDARVLKAGTPAKRYGAMLVHLAGRAQALPLGVAALADRQSHLERRIRAMTRSASKRTLARTAGLTALALAGLLAACEVRVPTTAQIEQMDGRTVNTWLDSAVGTTNAEYYIDGKRATAAEANALTTAKVVAVRVDVIPRRVDIRTQPLPVFASDVGQSADSTLSAKVTQGAVAPGTRRVTAVSSTEPRVSIATRIDKSQSREPFAGLAIIDGKIRDSDAVLQLDPKRIQSIEVIKGARALELYPHEARARNGVITVKTNQ